MVTKGIIDRVLSDKEVSVRCPKYEGIYFGASNSVRAFVCSIGGMSYNPKEGDVVFVEFENDSKVKPVVVGYLYCSKSLSTNPSLNIGSIVVENNANLTGNISIGSVTKTDIGYIKNTVDSIQNQIDSLTESYNMVSNNVSKLQDKVKLSDKEISEILTKIDNLYEQVISLDKRIGNVYDNDESTLFGRINVYNLQIDSLESSIGDISKYGSIENAVKSLEEKCSSVSDTIVQTNPVIDDESEYSIGSVSGMLGRAERMINVEWIPKRNVHMWNRSEYFLKGKKYIGIPYTLFSGAYKFDDWYKVRNDNKDYSAYVSGYGQRTGPYYGSCCADFVSEVLGLPEHTRNCGGFTEKGGYLKIIENAPMSSIQKGDAIINSKYTHIIWVGDITKDTITIYEQSIPSASKTVYDKNKYSRNGFFYRWEETYNIIVRPTEKLLSLESNKPTTPNIEIPSNWIVRGNKVYNAPASVQRLTDDEYFANGLIFWKMCKKNGWTAEAAAGAWANVYGESGGNPWSYGTGGGGIFGFTPFDTGTPYKTGIYDYANSVLGDANRRWNGDDQVNYLFWQIKNVVEKGWTGIFSKRGQRYWQYDPPSNTRIPKNDFGIDTYIKLNKKDYDATADICARLWLARYEVMDMTYGDRNTASGMQRTIDGHVAKATQLYDMFIKN